MMKKSLTLASFTFILSTLATIVSGKCPGEARRRQEVEECAYSSLIFGNYDTDWPRNLSQMSDFCEGRRKANKCVKRFASECLGRFEGNIVSTSMTIANRVLFQKCRNRIERNEFLKHMSCLRGDKAAPLHDCMTAFTRKIEWIANSTSLPDDMNMPAMCCAMSKMKKCIRDESLRVCVGTVVDVQETSDFFGDFIDEITTDASDLYCGRFSNPEVCAAHLPVAHKSFRAIERKRSDGRIPFGSSRSYIIPLANVFGKGI